MKTQYRLASFLLSFGWFACGDKSGASKAETVTVNFKNESQFEVESLFLHESALNYKDKLNLLKQPLLPGASLSESIPAQKWYVTVFRQPNKDSAVLAYTTAKAWDPAEYPNISYFDERFRVGR